MSEIKIYRGVPRGILSGGTLPHSFSFNGSEFVCYIKDGRETNSLGYGKTREQAFDDLVKNKRGDLRLSGILFEDWLHQFNLIQ